MSEPVEQPPSPKQSEPATKPDDGPGRADALALGIGCLVVILFFIAIVIVGMTRE